MEDQRVLDWLHEEREAYSAIVEKGRRYVDVLDEPTVVVAQYDVPRHHGYFEDLTKRFDTARDAMKSLLGGQRPPLSTSDMIPPTEHASRVVQSPPTDLSTSRIVATPAGAVRLPDTPFLTYVSLPEAPTIVQNIISNECFELACSQCETNLNCRGNFIAGLHGMWHHLLSKHIEHLDGEEDIRVDESIQDYVVRTCKIRAVSSEERDDIRSGEIEVEQRFPKTPRQMADLSSTFGFSLVAGHEHMVCFYIDGKQEPFSRKLYCGECKCDARHNGQWFSGVQGFCTHARNVHGEEVGHSNDEEIRYVMDNCPFIRLDPDEVAFVEAHGWEKPRRYVNAKQAEKAARRRKRRLAEREAAEVEDGEVPLLSSIREDIRGVVEYNAGGSDETSVHANVKRRPEVDVTSEHGGVKISVSDDVVEPPAKKRQLALRFKRA